MGFGSVRQTCEGSVAFERFRKGSMIGEIRSVSLSLPSSTSRRTLEPVTSLVTLPHTNGSSGATDRDVFLSASPEATDTASGDGDGAPWTATETAQSYFAAIAETIGVIAALTAAEGSAGAKAATPTEQTNIIVRPSLVFYEYSTCRGGNMTQVS